MIVITAVGVLCFSLLFYGTTRRGEDCPHYPYDCPICHHAPECMMKIARKNGSGKEPK